MPRPATKAQGVDWASIVLFVVLAFGLSWACFIGLRAAGVPFVLRTQIGMFGPAAAALLTRLLRHEPLSGLGLWPLGRPSFYLWAWLLPPLLLVAGGALALLTRYQHWDLDRNLAAYHRLLPRARGVVLTDQELLLIQAFSALTIGSLIGCIFTLGEELGWRGHLLPRLAPLGGPAAAVVTGVIWGLWHAPVIALDGYEYGIRSWAVAPFFCVLTVPLGVIMAWLRFRSASVWPCVLAHAVVDSGIATLVALALSHPTNPLIGQPAVGLIAVLPFWAVALWLLLTGRVRAPEAARLSSA